MTRPFDLVVFDFDGTLVQSNHIKDDGFTRLAERYPGGPEAMKIARAEQGLDRYAIAERFATALGFDAALVPKIGAEYGELVDRAVIDAPECPGAIPLLEALRRTEAETHLSSATPLENLEKVVHARGWCAYFSGLHGKPATKEDTLSKLIARTGARPDRIAVIGDGPDDRESAKAFGTAFFAVGDRLTDQPLMSLSDVQERLGC